MSSQETNYEHYFGTPEKTFNTVHFLSDSDGHPVAINLWYCGSCGQVHGECDQNCEKNKVEWLNSPYEGGKE